ncbi:MAG: hypothetical protein ACLFU2_10495 [Opitutales bacterium]
MRLHAPACFRCPRPAATALAALLTGGLTALAQPGGGRPETAYEATAVLLHQFEADLDAGGALAISSGQFRLGTSLPLDRRSQLGFEVGYGFDHYDFTLGGEDSWRARAPWKDIHRVELGVSYFRALENGWRVFVSPTIEAAEESALDRDALTYALVAGGSTEVSENLQLGLGFVVATGQEDTTAFPFISIRWEFAENWTLQNPFRPGPTGPAGLEVAYAGEDWSVAVGGAYRTWRFRIDGTGATRDGIADYEGASVFVRYTWQMSELFALDLYGGAFVGAELEIEDANGHDLGLRTDVSTAPFLALTVSSRF